MSKTLSELFNERVQRDAEEFYKKTGWVPTEWGVMNYSAGAQSVKDLLMELNASIDCAERYLTSCGYDKIEDCEPEKQMMLDLRKARAKLRTWLEGEKV